MVSKDVKLKVWFATSGAHRMTDYKAAVDRIAALGLSPEVLREVADGATYSKGVEFGDVRSRHKTSCGVRAIRDAADRLEAAA